MKDASYTQTWVDVETELSSALASSADKNASALRISRTYSSRSIRSGLFGFGWCSELDVAIASRSNGDLVLRECGEGPETLFVQKTRNNVKNATAKNETVKNETLRTPAPEAGAVFSASSRPLEKIVFAYGSYVRTTADGTRQRFDASGRLREVITRTDRRLSLSYGSSNRLLRVSSNDGSLIQIQLDPRGSRITQLQVTRSQAGPLHLIQYIYDGEDLIRVKDSLRGTFAYQYDTLHNLIRIDFPDKTFQTLAYDKDRDWVLVFRDRDACLETYTYRLHRDDPQNHHSASALRTCNAKTVARISYEFWHRKRSDGRSYLAKMKNESDGGATEFEYHPFHGQPLSVRRGAALTRYTYDENGLVRTRDAGAERAVFEYAPKTNKIARLTRIVLDSAGRTVRAPSVAYDYDKNGRPIRIRTSQGRALRLIYDDAGRLSRIEETGKQALRLIYQTRGSRPIAIEQTGSGRLDLRNATPRTRKTSVEDRAPTSLSLAQTVRELSALLNPSLSLSDVSE